MIKANAYSDDHVVDIQFDATQWFEQVENSDLETLADCGWGGEEPADYVAYYFEETLTKRLFDYLSFNPTMGYKNETVGFECYINESDAISWIKQNRPELFAARFANENIA